MQEAQPEPTLTTILIVRHTDVHNPQDVLYGRLPRFRLSELGLRQAERTAQVLAEEPIAAFYSSPQLRARQTARILAQPHPGTRVQTSKLLSEVSTAWQGRPHSELETMDFNFYANPLKPEDERLEQIWHRLNRFVQRARRRHSGETIVAVSHGDLCILARSGYLGLPIEIASMRRPQAYPGKGSLTRLTFTSDLKETYPLSVEYYDPNGEFEKWSQGWVKLPPEGAVLESV